jgi:N-acetylmuramoyl-L-alanine amidase
MTIKQNLVPASKYTPKCPNTMVPIGICVHNTANDASAKNEISYMVGNANQTSFHLAVDDIEAWQGLPLDRNGWHAGDGATGEGNRKYIAIEICYSKSGGEKFTKAEENGAELIAQLLKERNWGIERVKKHQDFSGKYCPHRTLDLGWDRFLDMVKTKLGGSMANELEVCMVDRMKFWKERDAALAEVVELEKKLVAEKDFSKRLLTNFIALANLLGLPENSNPDEIFVAVKKLKEQSIPTQPPISSPEGTLPAVIEVNGEEWSLNGVMVVDNKLQGNYKRN